MRTRGEIGGFSSVPELSVMMDLQPHALDHVADRMIFLPLQPQPGRR